jgi:hypothetical protein
VTSVVWVAIRQHNGVYVFHRHADCRRGQPRRYQRIPTTEAAAVSAGLVPCASCGADVAVAA